MQAPSGIRPLTTDAWEITPTAHEATLGTQVVTNLAFQYHFLKVFWPEMELNWNYYADGIRGGKNQVLLTFGVVLGRFVFQGRTGLTIGIGYQTAVAPTYRATPLIPAYDHAWIVTGRFTF